jgi:hypothetical protein
MLFFLSPDGDEKRELLVWIQPAQQSSVTALKKKRNFLGIDTAGLSFQVDH